MRGAFRPASAGIAGHSLPGMPSASAKRTTNAKGKAMGDNVDFTAMNDPDFLAERTRVREELQELTELAQKLDDEFDRRARAAWARAS